MDAKLTFRSREEAQSFAKAWASRTLRGHTVSAIKADGNTDVELYEITDSGKALIDQYVALKNIFN